MVNSSSSADHLSRASIEVKNEQGYTSPLVRLSGAETDRFTCSVKVKFTLEQVRKAQKESRGIALLFL